jgi:hypothetical protein
MTVQIVRFTTTEANVAEIDAGIGALITALDAARPAGTRYAAGRLADGVTYLLVLELDDGVENPLPALPEARAFQQRMAGWATEPPAPEPLTVVGSYGLLSASSPALDG